MSKVCHVRVHQKMVQPEPPPPSIQYQYFVNKWKDPSHGYLMEWDYNGLRVVGEFDALAYINGNNGDISIPIDPLTAMSLGAVTPEMLKFPPAVVAAFNLLKD